MNKTISPGRFILNLCLITATILAGLPITGSAQTTFFTESFDNTNFGARGWYDVSGGTADSANHIPGSTASFKCHWAKGGTKCPGPGRHLFTASPTVYMSFWMKLGSAAVTWRGSSLDYHPHLFVLLTDADGVFIGPNSSSLEFLIEPSLFKPRIGISDHLRINLGQLGNDLLGTATTHAVGGCNGDQNASGDCYTIGADRYNSTIWDSATSDYQNDTWHHVEVYVAMNSISGGVPQADGIIKHWVDGALVINRSNVYLRTAQYATQKFNQLALLPYIGDGSPIAQDLWIDNLIVAEQPLGQTALAAPTKLRVQ